MSSYVMSDIHGHYDAFMEMLDKIELNDTDKLYIIGDVIDCGKKPIATLLHIMNSKNMQLLCGNHEFMACLCLDFLLNEITEESLKKYTKDKIGLLQEWNSNGGGVTIMDLINYDKKTQNNIFKYLLSLKIYKKLSIGDKNFILVHGGFGNYKNTKKLKDYSIYELVWERMDYSKEYYKDSIIVTGHTPTCTIEGNDKPHKIYYENNNIDFDCGCTYGGNLGCLRLDDMKEFYVKVR